MLGLLMCFAGDGQCSGYLVWGHALFALGHMEEKIVMGPLQDCMMTYFVVVVDVLVFAKNLEEFLKCLFWHYFCCHYLINSGTKLSAK